MALRASDIDVIYANGYGFPAWRGGPMFYADRVGLGHGCSNASSAFHRELGERWRPAPLLDRLAREGSTFRGIRSRTRHARERSAGLSPALVETTEVRRLVLIRHANPALRSDVPPAEWGLSEAGVRRARALAGRVRPGSARAVHSSTERKAVETAQLLGTAWQLPVTPVLGLHEHERASRASRPGLGLRATRA